MYISFCPASFALTLRYPQDSVQMMLGQFHKFKRPKSFHKFLLIAADALRDFVNDAAQQRGAQDVKAFTDNGAQQVADRRNQREQRDNTGHGGGVLRGGTGLITG